MFDQSSEEDVKVIGEVSSSISAPARDVNAAEDPEAASSEYKSCRRLVLSGIASSKELICSDATFPAFKQVCSKDGKKANVFQANVKNNRQRKLHVPSLPFCKETIMVETRLQCSARCCTLLHAVVYRRSELQFVDELASFSKHKNKIQEGDF